MFKVFQIKKPFYSVGIVGFVFLTGRKRSKKMKLQPDKLLTIKRLKLTYASYIHFLNAGAVSWLMMIQ